MPMIAPATAVAISQRKNSWPSWMTSDTGVLDRRRAGGAGTRHRGGAFEKRGGADAERGGRHHSEIGQHGITPANRRQAVKDMAEAFRLRRFFEGGAGVGDRDKMLGRV